MFLFGLVLCLNWMVFYFSRSHGFTHRLSVRLFTGVIGIAPCILYVAMLGYYALNIPLSLLVPPLFLPLLALIHLL